MQFYSISRREPGQPMYIVLGKKVQGSGSSSGVTLTLSPNPATSVIRATFNITNAMKVSFAIVDMDGKIINRQADEALLPPGTYYRSINIQQLPQGTYGLQIMTGTGAAITKQFIKL